MIADRYALRFISGKDHGREIKLSQDREWVVGRDSDVDILILEDTVSRRHAKITSFGGRVVIEDIESRNGVFINGDRVGCAKLAEGDEIRIGSSTIKLLAVDAVSPPAAPIRPALEATQELRMSMPGSFMTGSIADVPLPDLLQLFVSTKKSGMLKLRSGREVGRIHLRDGQIFHVSLDSSVALAPRKAFYRMLRWKNGTFKLEPPNGMAVTDEITESTTALLLHGIQQLDETHLLEEKLPAADAKFSVPTKMPGDLHDLATEEVQMFQLVLHHETLAAVIDHFPGTDLEAYTCVLGLLRRGFIVVDNQGAAQFGENRLDFQPVPLAGRDG
jgi:hypothetical protein